MDRVPKLSLVAQFDDLTRYTEVLTAGCENNFKEFVNNQKKNARKHKNCLKENKNLKDQIHLLQATVQKHDSQMKLLRNAMDSEIGKRKQVELENDDMKKQISCIRDIILCNGTTMNREAQSSIDQLLNRLGLNQPVNTNHLGGIDDSVQSLLSNSDFDMTGNGVSTRLSGSRKRQSKSDQKAYGKKQRSSARFSKESDSTSKEDLYPKQKEIAFECKSEQHCIDVPDTGAPGLFSKIEDTCVKTPYMSSDSASDVTDNARTPTQNHTFVIRKNIKKHKCSYCRKHPDTFFKDFLKCTTCKIFLHKECQDQCRLKCIPLACTPTDTHKESSGAARGSVSDASSINVPPLLSTCINHIEANGLKERNIYSRDGNPKEVETLKNSLLYNSNALLDNMDIHSVCRTVIEFLQSHADSMIPVASYDMFLKFSEVEDEEAGLNILLDAVCELPQSCKESLAFLVLHLQKVAESKSCRMSLDKLAQIFGPILMQSNSETAESSHDLNKKKQCQTMLRLLKIPSELWHNMFSAEAPEAETAAYTTPKHLATPVSRLGPLLSNQKEEKKGSGSTPRRNSSSRRSGRKSRYLSPFF